MSEKFTVEIISPDKSVFNSEAKEVTIPSYEGQMGILKNHILQVQHWRSKVKQTLLNESNLRAEPQWSLTVTKKLSVGCGCQWFAVAWSGHSGTHSKLGLSS